MRGEDGFSRVRGTCAHSTIGSSRKFLLYRLPKVISEMVGQTCRFAATTRRSSPTISEISFGNHSIPEGKTIQWSAWRRNANGEGAVGRARGGRAPRFHPAP